MRENSATTAKQRSGLLSVVLPAYNEEATLFKTAKVIPSILDAAGIPFEIVFVSDGSKDGTWDEICAAAAGDPRLRGVRFSRNFGKEAAVFIVFVLLVGIVLSVFLLQEVGPVSNKPP